MAEILVLVEHDDGEVKKVTLELLTLARRFGEPAVVWAGPGAEQGQARCAEYGAAKVYVAADPAFDDYVVAPTAELLAAAGPGRPPGAVLIAGTAEGKEIAGPARGQDRLRLITDAVGPVPATTGPGRRAVDLRRRHRGPLAGQARAPRSWRCARTRSPPSRRRARPSWSQVSLAGAADWREGHRPGRWPSAASAPT